MSFAAPGRSKAGSMSTAPGKSPVAAPWIGLKRGPPAVLRRPDVGGRVRPWPTITVTPACAGLKLADSEALASPGVLPSLRSLPLTRTYTGMNGNGTAATMVCVGGAP